MTRDYQERPFDPGQGPTGWADREIKDTRAQIIRLQHEVEQRDARVDELTTRMRHMEELAEALGAELERVGGFSSVLERFENHVNELQGRVTSLDQRLDELTRRWHEEAERSRQIQNDLAKTLGHLDRAVQAWNSKVEALEEMSRRVQEVLAHYEQRIDGNDRQLESLEIRSARAVEASKRADQEYSRLSVEIDGLRAQDEALGERLQLFNEWLRHAESQMGALQEQVRLRQDVMDKLELQRVERQRLEDRVSEMAGLMESVRERLEEHQRLMGLLDGKSQGLQNRVNSLHEQVQSQRRQLAEQIMRMAQAQERQKRRQMEDLEREIRELQNYGFWPSDE